jgi:GABA permease
MVHKGVTVAHRVLLVANRTLADDDVLAAVEERVAAGATQLWIVAPVTTPSGVLMAGAAPTGEALPVRNREPDAAAYDLAERRVDEACARFRALGIDVGGEVGDPDPFEAVGKAMDRGRYTEVVVSTLPSAVSQWLRLDLSSRIQRKFKIPVLTVASRAD